MVLSKDSIGDYIRGFTALSSPENIRANIRDVAGTFFVGTAFLIATVAPIAVKAAEGYAKEKGWIE